MTYRHILMCEYDKMYRLRGILNNMGRFDMFLNNMGRVQKLLEQNGSYTWNWL